MQVQAVNQYAMQRYRELVSALDFARKTFDECAPLVAKMREDDNARANGWKVPSKKELQTLHKRAAAMLDQFRQDTKKYEKDLTARTWRA
jgi:hypothetical protein